MNENKLSENIYKIVNSNNPKTIQIHGKKKYINKKIINDIQNKSKEHTGGILPLAALLPLIFGGVAAAGGVAGGTASIVKAVNDKNTNDLKLQEDERHNKEMEKVARGDGLKEVIKDFVNKTGLEEESKKALKNTLKNLSNAIVVKPADGGGIFLSPK